MSSIIDNITNIRNTFMNETSSELGFDKQKPKVRDFFLHNYMIYETGNPMYGANVQKMKFRIAIVPEHKAKSIDYEPDPQTEIIYDSSQTNIDYGIALSELKWVILNPARKGGDHANPSFNATIHDVGGRFLDTYMAMRLNPAAYRIMVWVPKSVTVDYDGNPITDTPYLKRGIIYTVDRQNCSISFDRQRGFQYTISGLDFSTSMTDAKTSYAVYEQIILSGSEKANGVVNGTLADYIMQFEQKYNSQKPVADTKNISEQIKIYLSDENSSRWFSRTPTFVVNTTDGKDNGSEYVIEAGTSIESALSGFFSQKIPTAEEVKNLNPKLIVTHLGVDIASGKRAYKVYVWDTDTNIKSDIKTEANMSMRAHFLCMDDYNADLVANSIVTNYPAPPIHAFYRCDISNLDINGILDKIGNVPGIYEQTVDNSAPKNQPKGDQSGENVRDSTQQGVTPGSDNDNKVTDTKQVIPLTRRTEAKIRDFKSKFPLTDLELSISMPYTSGLHPEFLDYGCILRGVPSFEDTTKVALQSTHIAIENPCHFIFYWYRDRMAEHLENFDYLSGQYTITQVTHTIGLNGNSTDVTLTHFHHEPDPIKIY